MLQTLRRLDEQFAFQTSGRFDLLAGDHVALADETVQTIGRGHVQEAIARTPLAPPSGLARS